MPKIGDKEFAYDAQGMVAARNYALKISKSADASPKEKKQAAAILEEYAPKTAKDKTSAPKKKVTMMNGGMPKSRPQMMHGGMANKKPHMYSAGGYVKDYNKK